MLSVTLYTQDHKPLLAQGEHPTPLGSQAAALLESLCRQRGLVLQGCQVQADALCFCLAESPSPALLRELLTRLRRETAALWTRQAGSGYNAVLWQRQPLLEEIAP